MPTIETNDADDFDWSAATPEEAAAALDKLDTLAMNTLARSFDRADPAFALGWAVIDRPDCALETALTLFALTDPQGLRTSQADWRKRWATHRDFARAIESRINMRRFGPNPRLPMKQEHAKALTPHLRHPADRKGDEWAIDPAVVAPALMNVVHKVQTPAAFVPPPAAPRGFWAKVFG